MPKDEPPKCGSKTTSMKSQTDIIIIGGGIIGAACAYELSRRGLRVILVDKGRIGHACSYGNAGWITPCFAMPLPMPGMMFKALRWLMDRDSPLYIQPRLSLPLVRWLWKFSRSMNQPQMLASVQALTELSKISLREYQRLDKETPGAFGFHQRGLLMIAQSAAGLVAAEQERELVAAHGITGQSLTAQQVHETEPALDVIAGNVTGGVLFRDEAHVEPLATVEHLIKLAVQQGTNVLPHTEVLDFNTHGDVISGLVTTRGHLSSDQYVLATGAWSGVLARKLQLKIPMLSGKGYALIVPETHAPTVPQRPVLIIDRKVAITPRDNRSLRIAGTLELVDLDETVTLRRVQAIWRAARSVFPQLPVEMHIHEIWRGLRPCTPDGLPIIGATPRWRNLTIAAGHQMLGLQTAPGTAQLLADMLTQRHPCTNPQQFCPVRFSV